MLLSQAVVGARFEGYSSVNTLFVSSFEFAFVRPKMTPYMPEVHSEILLTWRCLTRYIRDVNRGFNLE